MFSNWIIHKTFEFMIYCLYDLIKKGIHST